MIKTASPSKLEFSIKLLSGNNVVLVNCDGYESELFMPQIVQGRITFQNIIPNRRCCAAATLSTKPLIIKTTPVKGRSCVRSSKPERTTRISAGEEASLLPLPLAFSTPTSSSDKSIQEQQQEQIARKTFMKVVVGDKENLNGAYISNSTVDSLLSPQDMRRATAGKDSFLHFKSLPQLKSTMGDTNERTNFNNKGKQLFNIPPTSAGPHVLGRVVGTLRSSPNRLASHSKVHDVLNSYLDDLSGFQLPSSPNTSVVKKAPKTKTPGTVTKWRKCITPVRTYTRRKSNAPNAVNNNNNKIKASTSTLLPKKRLSAANWKNGTKPPNPTMKVEIRRRRLIVDAKMHISPQAFKKQQQVQQPSPQSESKSRKAKKLILPKKRKQYEKSKSTAFDLLTTASRAPNMSDKLNKQFQKCCINKSSTTYPKYKLIASVQPLPMRKTAPSIHTFNKTDKNHLLAPKNSTNNEAPRKVATPQSLRTNYTQR